VTIKVTKENKTSEGTMDTPTSDLHFRFMSFGFKIRDLFLPRKDILSEIGIKPGFHILDYGCGSGSYSIPAADMVGSSGKVYALDIHPLAIRRLRDIASKRRLTNIEIICSACATGLSNDSVDVVLLYDTFHCLSEPDEVLKELYRVLKRNGILSFSDHHLREKEIVPKVTNSSLFKLLKKGKRTYSLSKGQ